MSPTSYQTAPPRSEPEPSRPGLPLSSRRPWTRRANPDRFGRCVRARLRLSSATSFRNVMDARTVRERRLVLKGVRRAGLVALVAIGLVASARQAGAAAELHRLNLILSSTPTSLTAKDLNEYLANFNRIHLETRGLEGLDKISFAWLHQAELRFFVRPNVAVSAGFGQIHVRSSREF